MNPKTKWSIWKFFWYESWQCGLAVTTATWLAVIPLESIFNIVQLHIQNPVKHIRWNVLLLAVDCFHKTFHLICLKGFWIRLWYANSLNKYFSALLCILHGDYLKDNSIWYLTQNSHIARHNQVRTSISKTKYTL